MLPDFDLLRPTSLDEALTVVDEDHIPISGGTELLLVMKMGMSTPEALVDVTRLDELDRLLIEDGQLVVGGGVAHRSVHRDPEVQRRLPVLAAVEEAVGNARVRAQGTVGGNLCFAEPRSDLATVLIGLDASVVLASAQHRRELPMAEFIEGPYTTVREDTELLVEVRIPVQPRRGNYAKLQTVERPTVGVAAIADDDRVRIVVGAVGAVPVHRDFPSVGAVDVDAIMDLVAPLPDLTGSEEYKRHVTEVYIRRALEGLA